MIEELDVEVADKEEGGAVAVVAVKGEEDVEPLAFVEITRTV